MSTATLPILASPSAAPVPAAAGWQPSPYLHVSDDGGGDYEEAVEAALDATIHELNWRKNSDTSRVSVVSCSLAYRLAPSRRSRGTRTVSLVFSIRHLLPYSLP